MDQKLPFTQEEFDDIYSKVPRLTVEVLLNDPIKGTYLTLRDIEPCKGQWHLPGGTVFFGESLETSVKRVAEREIGIDVIASHMVGLIEYPGHYKNGMDQPVGIVFLVDDYKGEVTVNDEAAKGQWFTKLPEPMHGEQDTFLLDHHYIEK